MSEEEKEQQHQQDQHSRLIEIRSTEVQEIMGFIPHWLIRWGISIFFIVVGFLVVGSWFFKYPDIITSSIVVTTNDPPAAVMARATGKIQELFIADKQKVEADDVLAIIESAAVYADVAKLKGRLTSLKELLNAFSTDFFLSAEFGQDNSLGELQSHYEIFRKSYSDYKHFIKLSYHKTKIRSTREQLERQRVYLRQLERQKDILEEEFQLQGQKYQRMQSLYKDGIISQNDFETAKSAFLQKRHSLEGARTRITTEKMQVAKLNDSILDLELEFSKQQKQLQLVLRQSFDNLVSQIDVWEHTYVLTAPIAGVVSMTRFWSENQNVKAGDVVITIVPSKDSEIIGKLVLPIEGSGKVKMGQRVNIKFSNFPHKQYGMVTGIVKSKSLVATDNAYILEVELPNGLLTNYGKKLEFSQEMRGIADIITEDIRLIQRIFAPIKSLMEAHSYQNEPNEQG